MPELFSTITHYSAIILPWFVVGIIFSYLVDKYINRDYLKKFSGLLSVKKIVLSQVHAAVDIQ